MREVKGLSQDELAEVLDVSRQTISNWETGRVKPDIGKIVLLCEKFGLSMDEFLLGREKAEDAPAITAAKPNVQGGKITKKTLIRTAIVSAAAMVALIIFAFIVLFIDSDIAKESLFTVEISLFIGLMLGAGLFFFLLIAVIILIFGRGGNEPPKN